MIYLIELTITFIILQDMSAYVKKIQFKLHESYGNPLRGEETIYISVMGWG